MVLSQLFKYLYSIFYWGFSFQGLGVMRVRILLRPEDWSSVAVFLFAVVKFCGREIFRTLGWFFFSGISRFGVNIIMFFKNLETFRWNRWMQFPQSWGKVIDEGRSKSEDFLFRSRCFWLQSDSFPMLLCATKFENRTKFGQIAEISYFLGDSFSQMGPKLPDFWTTSNRRFCSIAH